MKLIKIQKELEVNKEFPGLIKATLKHKIESSTGSLGYSGPMIEPEVWNQILSFFKWTYDTHKSESQVRLYVHPQQRLWRAWAFPQKSGLGLSAEELSILESPEESTQRFATWGVAPSGDWILFGTVHHHCNISAFQSGTDEANESNPTGRKGGVNNEIGLHITVGHIDRVQHDLHCRFYLGSSCFEPDMSLFWEVGQTPRELLPEDLLDRVARYQMGHSSNVAFPEKWKENVMELRRPTVTSMTTSPGGTVKSYSTPYPYNQQGKPNLFAMDWNERCNRAVLSIVEALAPGVMEFSPADIGAVGQTLENLDNNEIVEVTLKAMEEYEVGLSTIVAWWPKDENALFAMAIEIDNMDNPKSTKKDDVKDVKTIADKTPTQYPQEDRYWLR